MRHCLQCGQQDCTVCQYTEEPSWDEVEVCFLCRTPLNDRARPAMTREQFDSVAESVTSFVAAVGGFFAFCLIIALVSQ